MGVIVGDFLFVVFFGVGEDFYLSPLKGNARVFEGVLHPAG